MRLHSLILTTLITCSLSTTAFAHRVNIFAWIEGSTVHTESSFSGGKKARNNTVTATDKHTGKIIASGTTNAKGQWKFSLSPSALQSKSPIIIKLEAGQGHASTWTLEKDDFTSVHTQHEFGAAPEPTTTPYSSDITISNTELQMLIRSAVKQEVTPISAQIAKLNAQITQPKTTIKDIFGGIGYILGLLGLAAFMRYRKDN